MKGFHNIFACLVHERRECVVDLVRNLRYLDPSSTILLYNGGGDPDLLTRGFPFERYGAVIHPRPRPLEWGRLHDFALDCGRFALERLPFDTMTIVDSDQLATRPGYSEALARFLSDRPRVGMIASEAGPQPADSKVHPVVAAFEEVDLWRPFLKRFPDGESKYVHWTFWPGTVFTRAALRDLLRLFDEDLVLRQTLARSRIWATEEILLPTLTAVLGHEIVASPFRRDFVQFRIAYTGTQIEAALTSDDVFWVHPIPRLYADGRRRHIRERLGHYVAPFAVDGQTEPRRGSRHVSSPAPSPRPAILHQMEQTEGWLSRVEAELLIRITEHAIAEHPAPATIVEVGSYLGRATVVLGGVARSMGADTRVYAIDPHDGIVGATDCGLISVPATLERFRANIERAGLADTVTTIISASAEVSWDRPIGFLLIDGLHDYVNVALDFFRFEPWLVADAYLAFHDYGDHFPGVKAFVDERLASGRFAKVDLAGSLIVLRKRGAVASTPFARRRDAKSAEHRSFIDVYDIDFHDGQRTFNPSIAGSRERVVISYTTAPNDGGDYAINLAEFDANLALRSQRTLDFSKFGEHCSHAEDMRLFDHQGQLHGVYYEGRLSDDDGGLNLVTFDDDLGLTSLERLQSPAMRPRHLEKNWQFFSQGDDLFGVYTIRPHQVFRKIPGGIEPFATTQWEADWPWGQLRGGTPPIAFEGEYLSFFHSHLAPDRCWSWSDRTYYVGAYTFAASPPFGVTRVTSEPLMIAPIDDKVSGYPAVVFPCGAFWHDGEIVITYGYHDHRARAAIYHPTALALRLVEVTPGP